MKLLPKIILGALLLASLPVVWTGCVGAVAVDGGVGYGGGPWFGDGVWLDGGGRGWYGGERGHGSYVHPGRGGGDRGGGNRGGNRH